MPHFAQSAGPVRPTWFFVPPHRGLLALVCGVAGVVAPPAVAATVSLPETSPDLFYQPLPTDLEYTVAAALPEGSNVDADFTDPTYEPYVTLSQDANVFVSFVDEGAGYRNSLGYYTFDDSTFSGLTKSAIDTDGSGVVDLTELAAVDGVETGWIFGNSSKSGGGGQLDAGDTLSLNGGLPFSAGTNVGFFLTQNSWTGSGVDLGDGGQETQVFYSNDFLNPEASGLSTDGDLSIADSARHVAMLFANDLRDGLILAFEDLNRVDRYENDYGYASDEDFNDAVFYVTTNPVQALQGTNVPETGVSVVPLPASLAPLGTGVLLLSVPAVVRRRRANAALAAQR